MMAEHAQGRSGNMLLPQLPEHLLLVVLERLRGSELARFECASSTTRRSGLAEHAAQVRLGRRPDGWRVAPRAGESWKWLLHALECGLVWPLPRLAAGMSHTVVAGGGTRLWACGSDAFGQLGVGPTDQLCMQQPRQHACAHAAQPVFSPAHYSFVAVAAGEAHSIALASDGSVFAWGCADLGQLGLAEVEPDGGVVVAAPRKLEPSRPAPCRLSVGGATGQVGGADHTASELDNVFRGSSSEAAAEGGLSKWHKSVLRVSGGRFVSMRDE